VQEAMLTLAQVVESRARLTPLRVVVRDQTRALHYRAWNTRANRLANALLGRGLLKGDRVGVLAYNCLEWAEIYLATAKAGLIAVPINFRLAPREIQYILHDAGVRAVITQDVLQPQIDSIRADLALPSDAFIHFGAPRPSADWLDYEALIAQARDTQPDVLITPEDPWALMYTSGTTGNPKGVIRNHRSMALIALVTSVELSIHSDDDALLVMPMCHANSLNFFCSYIYSHAKVTVYAHPHFDPAHVLHVMSEGAISFTSLVPTQYGMLLDLPAKERAAHNLQRVKRMMISSAPARSDTKRAVMEMFPNTGLYELYGSSEAGWVTMLHPADQFSHLGTVGRECVGSAPIQLIGADGEEVADGEPGELFSATPYPFSGYWNQPEKTRQAFRGTRCSVGDIALRDAHGFIRLIDRKENVIISGGENIYAAEVEAVLATSPLIQDAAVVGLPDETWGERVHAAVILRPEQPANAQHIIDWCRARLAHYKCPRGISFLSEHDMPRTATGKVRHRALRAVLQSLHAGSVQALHAPQKTSPQTHHALPSTGTLP